MFDLHTISFLLIFIAAGLGKGVTGMGLPTVAMGLLGLLMPPRMQRRCWCFPRCSPISGSYWQARRWRRLYAVSGL